MVGETRRGRRRPEEGSGALDFLLAALLVAQVAAGCLAFGGVFPWVGAALFLTSLATFILLLLTRLRSGPGLPCAGVLLPLGVVLLFAGLQLWPLDAGTLESLSPFAADTRAFATGAGAGPLSLAPERGREQLLPLAAALLVLCIAGALGRRRGPIWLIGGGLVLLGGFEAGYGIVQNASGRHEIWGWVRDTGALDVATGTFVNRNQLAGLLAALIPVALGLACAVSGLWQRARRRRSLRIGGYLASDRFWKAVLLLASALLMLGGIADSASRGGFAAALLGIASFGLFLALAGTARQRPRWPLAVLAAGVLLGVVGLGFVGYASGHLGERLRQLAAKLEEGEPVTRVALIEGTAALGAEAPWTGVGLGGFRSTFPRFAPPLPPDRAVYHAHCDFLQVPAELGWPAALLAYGALAWLGLSVLRALRRATGADRCLLAGFGAALVPIAVRSLFDFDLQLTGPLLLAACLAGTALACVQLSQGGKGGRAGLALLGCCLLVPGALTVYETDRLAWPDVVRSRELEPPAVRLERIEAALALRPEHPELLLRLAQTRVEVWTDTLEAAARLHSGRGEQVTARQRAIERAFVRAQRDSTRAVLREACRTVERALLSEPAAPQLHAALAGWLSDDPEALPDGLARLERAARAVARLAPRDAGLRLPVACAVLARRSVLPADLIDEAGQTLRAVLAAVPSAIGPATARALAGGFLPRLAAALPARLDTWQRFAAGLARSHRWLEAARALDACSALEAGGGAWEAYTRERLTVPDTAQRLDIPVWWRDQAPAPPPAGGWRLELRSRLGTRVLVPDAAARVFVRIRARSPDGPMLLGVRLGRSAVRHLLADDFVQEWVVALPALPGAELELFPATHPHTPRRAVQVTGVEVFWE